MLGALTVRGLAAWSAGAAGSCLLLLRWRSAEDGAIVYTLLVLPALAVVLPVIAWSRLRPGWRITASRPTGAARPAAAALVSTLVALTSTTVLLAVAYGLDGLGPHRGLLLVLASAGPGTMLLALSWWLTVRLGVLAALVVNAVGIVVGALVGGTDLQAALWLVAPWAWAGLAGQRLYLVPVSLLLGLIFAGATLRAARRTAGRT